MSDTEIFPTIDDSVITINTDDQVKTGLGIRDQKIYSLVPETDPILKEVMPEWDFKNPPEDAVKLASNLVDTCIYHRGYGLSANQCGLRYRVFVMGAGNEYVAFFNPKLLSTEGEKHMTEGCLSFPFLGLSITRPEVVKVEYQTYTGEVKVATFGGISARCFLHELDHMNGIVYTTKVKPLALQMGIQKRKKLMKKYNVKMVTQ